MLEYFWIFFVVVKLLCFCEYGLYIYGFRKIFVIVKIYRFGFYNFLNKVNYLYNIFIVFVIISITEWFKVYGGRGYM